MNTLKTISVILSAGVLAACSSSTPPADGAARNVAGNYFIVQNGETAIIANASAASADGFRAWGSSNAAIASHKGYVYDSPDVLAIAVMELTTNATVAGISGFPASFVQVTGSADYAGGFSGTYFRGGAKNAPWNVRGAFTTNVNFASGGVTGSGTGSGSSSLSITGTVSGTQISGTATFSAVEDGGVALAPLTGGFYGNSTLAGVYQSTDVTGIIWGVRP